MTNTYPSSKMLRTATIGLAIMFLLQNLLPMVNSYQHSRWYRDLTGQTPFHSVIVYNTTVTDRQISMIGELVKRRCDFDTNGQGLIGYLKFSNSPKVRVRVNTDIEDAVTGLINSDRPSSSESELWGPWTLTNPTRSTPKSWEVYAGHWCPLYDDYGNFIVDIETGKVVKAFESNLFAEGIWE